MDWYARAKLLCDYFERICIFFSVGFADSKCPNEYDNECERTELQEFMSLEIHLYDFWCIFSHKYAQLHYMILIYIEYNNIYTAIV